ncbi:glycosyltransferase [Xylella fastidiosa subsp. pauca]|nr:glycosyltransferase [Xylella fastidiosa]ALQ96539.2 glycosyltransferase [Xylella fastidiosa]ARO68191.1 UDP-glucuronate--glycolipid 2-beta-glucuronosyltransferase [Xylella fastidiosa subsp. pauca]ETE34172.1 glycosyl transferase family 1 [Xylella fastidiosa 32]MDG5823834.1 glycosyltransferase [Xylella fastidiosa subsp. pauca]MDG5824895.1 glycosyltransferase [Xylella fastidiosa subsp. pauca]
MNASTSAVLSHDANVSTMSVGVRPNYLVLSAHDYRTPRRASIHFITDELAKRGDTRFFSLRYSLLSRLKKDLRVPLDEYANHVVEYNGVHCYLWRTLVHPFNTRRSWLRGIEDMLFRWYVQHPPEILLQWIREADIILFESGTAVAFIDMAKRINPSARLIYNASDSLSAINVACYIEREFQRVAASLDVIAVVSPAMTKEIPSHGNVFYIGHGVLQNLSELGGPSPYEGGIHAVSVGSMLFDPLFFVVAGKEFPHITFHVIGSGMGRHPDYPDNVVVYGEMKYVETIRYIRHASFGIAPYVSQQVPEYLADSSMKLLQYDFFGLPAVCPHAVVGSYPTRFGYTPGNAIELVAAIKRALQAPHQQSRQYLSWEEVVARVLDPTAYEGTRILPAV